MAKIGILIDGKYEILREIGRGGMSVVYLAMDIRLNKQWAIKEIERRANDANNDIVVSSLLAEANLMKKLDHPALPRIVDIIEERDTIYVVMDYIEGEPLSKVLEVYGAQDQDLVIEWGKQLCDVLYYLHNCEPPIIYRDMKPANIMLRPDGSVKLIDFGIAREYKRSKNADTESLGTRGYAAPEQFGGRGQTDARTDIYSFGVTLYHLVTGKNPCEPPYELYPIKQINPAFYDGLQYLIQKCTQMNPSERFQSCDEIRYVLDNIKEFDKGRRISQNRKYKSFLAMTALGVIFAILGGISLGAGRAALNRDFNATLEKIENTAIITDIEESYDTLTKQSGLSSEKQLQLLATYYKALDNASESSSASMIVKSPLSLVEVKASSDEENQEAGIDFNSLSNDERTYLALAYYYQGRLLFKQNSASSSVNAFSQAEQSFSYLIDASKLNLLADESAGTYDSEIITDSLIKSANAMYYLSGAYSIYFKQKDNSKSVALGDTESSQLDVAETFDRLKQSTEILADDEIKGLRANMFKVYYNILNDDTTLQLCKNSGITADDVNVIYRTVYGEGYMDLYNQAAGKYGDPKNITKDQKKDLKQPASPDGGIDMYSNDISSAVYDELNSGRFDVALKIYNMYNS